MTGTESAVAGATSPEMSATPQSPEAPEVPRGSIGTASDPATAALVRGGSLPTASQAALAAKDRTLTSATAVELARAALMEITIPETIGAHTAARADAERLVTHLFECTLAGYRGWRWAVTMSRSPRSRTATVVELELLPGEDALLAPVWVPWADRLAPGDVGRSDRLPLRETDERLEPGWEATGDEEGDRVALDELDLGRARVLSPEGVQRAAQRWYDGDHGPHADGVRKAHATCSTCGFFIPMTGPFRQAFGICANEWAPDDGAVVSLDHGCGAHSETDVPDQGPEWPVAPSRVDEGRMEVVASDGRDLRGGVPLDEVAEEGPPAGGTAGPVAERSAEEAAGPAADEAPQAPGPVGVAPGAETRAPVGDDEPGPAGTGEDRAVSARDAVAGLAAELGAERSTGPVAPAGPSGGPDAEDEAADSVTALTSLADLEALMPTRA
ncbi:DUF3027 domain-containing protein [Actinomyces gaoshouyii]|uniref:DUF3027 domain-containing protein n=1 Tax=Actinomyces gaoshouyii TaxID=1960083 RepID=UPI0009B5548A|nr:DUF3027 domain-containing protein [Actinomyces gaoshouyii]